MELGVDKTSLAKVGITYMYICKFANKYFNDDNFRRPTIRQSHIENL